MAKIAMSKNLKDNYKTGINLAQKEESAIPLRKLIPWLIVILIGAAALSKFGVMDRLNKLNKAEGQAEEAQFQLELAQKALANYAEVEAEYRRYSIGWMGDTEAAYIKRVDMLSLIQKELLPAARLLDVASTPTALSVSVSGISLRAASELVTKLSARDDVSLVTFGSAQTKTGDDTNLVITFSINMVNPEKED